MEITCTSLPLRCLITPRPSTWRRIDSPVGGRRHSRRRPSSPSRTLRCRGPPGSGAAQRSKGLIASCRGQSGPRRVQRHTPRIREHPLCDPREVPGHRGAGRGPVGGRRPESRRGAAESVTPVCRSSTTQDSGVPEGDASLHVGVEDRGELAMGAGAFCDPVVPLLRVGGQVYGARISNRQRDRQRVLWDAVIGVPPKGDARQDHHRAVGAPGMIHRVTSRSVFRQASRSRESSSERWPGRARTRLSSALAPNCAVEVLFLLQGPAQWSVVSRLVRIVRPGFVPWGCRRRWSGRLRRRRRVKIRRCRRWRCQGRPGGHLR